MEGWGHSVAKLPPGSVLAYAATWRTVAGSLSFRVIYAD